jgi:hypothetical protein
MAPEQEISSIQPTELSVDHGVFQSQEVLNVDDFDSIDTTEMFDSNPSTTTNDETNVLTDRLKLLQDNPDIVWIPINISAFKPREFTPEVEKKRWIFEISNKQWDIPSKKEYDAIPWKGHVWEKICMKDAMKRGRNLGSIKDRFERSAVYGRLALDATAVDLGTSVLRFGAKKWMDEKYPEADKSISQGKTTLFDLSGKNRSPDVLEKIEKKHDIANKVFGASSIGLEIILDTVINTKVDEKLSKDLSEPDFHYASKLSKNSANIANIVGGLVPEQMTIWKKKDDESMKFVNAILYSDIANAPLIEGVMRIAYQDPLGAGRIVEKVYDKANNLIDTIEANPTAKWWEGFAFGIFNFMAAGSGRTINKSCTSCSGGACAACR